VSAPKAAARIGQSTSVAFSKELIGHDPRAKAIA